jgi:NTP pyrophosphatase (non-canonical NTP hydrolase)
MLRDYFPNSEEGSKIYGGFMTDKNLFCKTFASTDSIENMLLDVNKFLIDNGYKAIEVNEIDKEDFSYDDYPVSLSLNPYLEEFILQIWRDPFAKTQTSFLINELKSFRDERDWEQFHNAKDLSIALSIEANELLELFLWKNPEDANKDKLTEELADVFAYALLLADKLDLDVEKIVLEKIKRNGEKYPVNKAKGTAKKYNEL